MEKTKSRFSTAYILFQYEGEGLGCLSQSGMEGEKGFERGRSAPL